MELLSAAKQADPKNPPTPTMILESGFSLSEQAHEEDIVPVTNSRLSTANTDGTFNVTGSTPSIEELRQQIVDDVVGCCSRITHNKRPEDNAANHQQQQQQQQATVVTSPMEFQPGQPAKLPLVYCDFTASHRPLRSIENYLSRQCMPLYGNTHTNTSLTGSQSTAFCSEARQIVGEACGAKTTGKASRDVVLFAGNGTTSSIELLIDCLGLKHYIARIENNSDTEDKPVIFVGPYEHHSNLLPWRELGHVDIEMVRLDSNTGNIDLQHLEELLKQYHKLQRQVKIGAFSAASNVTGVIANDVAITSLLHQYGALSIWDYATAASYIDVQMNPTHPDYDHELIAKDAVILSGHKLLGGVGTPGVLIIKKHLVSQQNPPTRSGGGTVFYVTQDHHRFLSNRVERFEGGTPNIVGIWRLGLAFTAKSQLKKQFQQALIAQNDVSKTLLDYDLSRAHRIQQQLCAIPNLALIDASFYANGEKCNESKKLPVFSFLIKCGTRFLHYNYVCALLNDIFGIQSRGGCQCAGPFAQYLLGLHGLINAAVEECLVHTKDELLRPGFTRVSLPTFGTTDAIEKYVITAITWVAENGWKFMHVYRCNHRTGEWRHKSRPGAPLGKTTRKWLSHYRSLQGVSQDLQSSESSIQHPSLEEGLATANKLLELVLQDHSSSMQAVKMSSEEDEDSSTLSSLRWYVYPKEVAAFLQQGSEHVPGTMDRGALLGAVRPIAWFPVTADVRTLQRPVPNKRDQYPENVYFREGDHTGTASMEEIRHGFEDGELTEACQIYNPTTDSWDSIVNACRNLSLKPDLDSASKIADANLKNSSSDTSQKWTAAGESVSFRDGAHSGQASWEEIETGYDDGELSAFCEIYNAQGDEWEKIDVALSQRHQPTKTKTPTLRNKVAASMDASDVPVLEKNEKKKPQRDSASWGQGTMVPIHASTLPVESHGARASKQERRGHIRPPPKLMRLVTQAMIQWDMLEEGDRLLLGLSGGKDSLSLLHVLLEFQKKLPINFEIEVCTIDPMTPSFDPSPLIPYVESLGLKYHFIRDEIVERATNAGKDGAMVSSLCSFCARMKRGLLYSCARRNNCNKLVLAQHLDDLAESFMMSVMHNGFLRTMKANYKINAGDLSVIRPFVYCRESLMTGFAKENCLPVINENCPACFEEPKERARMKKLLSKEEALYPNFYDNIKRSMLPLMHDDATAILRSYTEEALAKSRKENQKKIRPNVGLRQPNGSSLNEESEEKKEGTFEGCPDEDHHPAILADYSDEQLVKELARRRAEKFRLAGAMKRTDDDEYDPTGQVCTLNGGNDSIPCRELME